MPAKQTFIYVIRVVVKLVGYSVVLQF